MTRKPPKRANEPSHTRLETERLCDLAHILSDDTYVVGPQDEADIIDALLELVYRRNAERLIQSLTVDEERSVA